MIIGVGSDIVEIDRIAALIQRKGSFLNRILTEREQTYLANRSAERTVEFVAGRFAAKEAVAKALGTGIGRLLSFQDMEIIPDSMGKPTVVLSQRVLTEHSLADRSNIHLTISHSRTFAIAYVVIERI
ncbi:holo-ACP synthase [Brevibacillus ginsengisoli]|uniref:holo-ACP synthase n=1 Tax=Brevibacillus ginsengisoli TaxID=363854 RepID=UPI003CE99330